MVTGYASWLANVADEIKEINACRVTTSNIERLSQLLHSTDEKVMMRGVDLIYAIDFPVRDINAIESHRNFFIEPSGTETEWDDE
jgi:hypothetical protein